MKSPLRKRIPRELKTDFGKYLVIFLFLTATIGFVSGFLVAGSSMITAYNESFEKYNIEDGNFELMEEADDTLLTELEKEGVTIYENYYLEEAVVNGKSDSTLRIFKPRNEVDKVCLMDGEMPQQEDEIAIDRMYADNNSLKVGDTIKVGGEKKTISGLVALSDYSALFSDSKDLMFDAIKFGVAIATEDAFDAYGTGNLHYSYSWKYEKTPADDTEAKEKAEDFMKVLGSKAAIAAYIPAFSNQAIHFTGDDMGGDKTMVMTLLYILIAIMAFVFAVTTNNTITKEAAVIGTLRASGYTRGELLRHYLHLPVLVTIVAAIIGNILGYTVFKNMVADLYYGSYSLPTYHTIWNGDAFILTTVIPAIIMIVINLLLISSKLRISPLNFLRRDLSRRKRKKAVKLPHFKFFNRFRIRIILQNRAGYLTLFIGIAFAEILLVFGMMMSPLLDHYQDEVLSHMLADYQYVLKAPVPTETDSAEAYLAGSLKTMPTEFNSEEVSVYGVEKDSAYVDIDFPKEGVYISDSYAEKYRLAEGDTIELKETYGDKKYKFKVAGIYEYPAAVAIFMPEEEYRDVFDKEEDYFNGYFSDKKITDIEDAYIMTTITEDDLTKVSRQLDVSMGGMFYLMNVFSVALAAILIYLMTKLIIEQNASSISMVKILGYNTREIGKLYLTATTWIVVISVILGEAIATETINVIYRAMMSDYSGWLSIYYDPNIYWKILLMVLAAYFVVALFCLRKIRKIPMDEALKNVE